LNRNKKKIQSSFARVYINASHNNTALVATTSNGNVLAWHSAGSCGFKGSRKATPHAATEAATAFVAKIKAFGVKTGEIVLKGITPGRDAAVKILQYSGIFFERIYDRTGYAHNGVRPKGRRRV
jgi:small subunit ribosomal protein S11